MWFLRVLAVLVITALIFSKLGLDERIDAQFKEGTILYYLVSNEVAYLIYYILLKSLGLFSLSMLGLYITDYFNSYVKSSLAFIIIMWVLTPFLHKILPFYFVPFMTFMIHVYVRITLIQHIVPYLVVLGLILLFKVNTKYEVD